MPVDTTYAELADRVLKVRKSQNAQRIIIATVLLLLIASAFGYVVPDPIHWYD